MSEKCPLTAGELRIDAIPGYCLSHCEPLWDKAIRTQVGYADWYDASKDDCDHEQHDVEYSHEALQKPDQSAKRVYSIVDRCAGCEVELMETDYTFECPNN
jgi:hypothetical protein